MAGCDGVAADAEMGAAGVAVVGCGASGLGAAGVDVALAGAGGGGDVGRSDTGDGAVACVGAGGTRGDVAAVCAALGIDDAAAPGAIVVGAGDDVVGGDAGGPSAGGADGVDEVPALAAFGDDGGARAGDGGGGPIDGVEGAPSLTYSVVAAVGGGVGLDDVTCVVAGDGAAHGARAGDGGGELNDEAFTGVCDDGGVCLGAGASTGAGVDHGADADADARGGSEAADAGLNGSVGGFSALDEGSRSGADAYSDHGAAGAGLPGMGAEGSNTCIAAASITTRHASIGSLAAPDLGARDVTCI
eukprot:SAG11_NODE_374_length_10006_cov_8.964167_1_plen_302_part_00